jgi:hypothetical protein
MERTFSKNDLTMQYRQIMTLICIRGLIDSKMISHRYSIAIRLAHNILVVVLVPEYIGCLNEFLIFLKATIHSETSSRLIIYVYYRFENKFNLSIYCSQRGRACLEENTKCSCNNSAVRRANMKICFY